MATIIITVTTYETMLQIDLNTVNLLILAAIWRILPLHIRSFLNSLILVIISMSLVKAIYFGGYWRFLGSIQLYQFKSLPNINRFTVNAMPSR